MAQVAGFVISMVAVAAVAAFGGIFAATVWYQEIAKPSWAPPEWVFGPVWTVLYFTMGVAAWMVWRQRAGRLGFCALGVYLLQLVFNGLWSWIFFGLRQIGAALVDLVVLWVFIGLTLYLFAKVNRWAAMLLLPYGLWVTFAGFLNYAIWLLNR